MKKVNFLTFFWGDKYTDLHVNILYRALREYCNFKFEFHVLTDRVLEIDSDIHQWELWHDHEAEGRCWRRLRAFEKETMHFLPHYFALDIDILLMPGFGELVESVYGNDLTMCRSENPKYPKNPFSGTIWQVGKLKVADELVWQGFCRLKKRGRCTPLYRMAEFLKCKGYNGSDSAVLGFCLSHVAIPTIGAAQGIYSYPHHIKAPGLYEPPPNASVVLFHGKDNDFLRSDVAVKYEFVDNYLRKFCHKSEKSVTMESMAEKHFRNINIDAEFLDSLRGFYKEVSQIS